MQKNPDPKNELVALKFRTDGEYLVGTAHFDGRPIVELTRIHLRLFPEPRGEDHMEWVRLISRLFGQSFSEALKAAGVMAEDGSMQMNLREPEEDARD